MKYAFLSDIHGNATALEAVLEDISKQKVDKVFVLGDICYRGMEPKKSLQLVQSLNTKVIKGNADEWVVRGIKEGEVPQEVIEMMRTERNFTVSQLNDEDIAYLNGLPEQFDVELMDGVTIHGFHATPTSLFDVVPPTEDNETMEKKLMTKKEANIFVYGHIHLPFVRFFNGKCVANLGSVGLPFDGDHRASYLITTGENGHYELKTRRVDYDISKVMKQLEESDYPNKAFLRHIF